MTIYKKFSMDMDDAVTDLRVDEQVVQAARQLQTTNPKLSYTEAQELALSANPKLAKAYVDFNGERDRDGNVIRPSYEQEA